MHSLWRRRTGWVLVAASLLLHLFTVFCFVRQPDRFAAFTVLPIWLWGGFGLLLSASAFYFLRAPLSLILTTVWIVTLLVGADEARALANLGKTPPQPGPAGFHEGLPVLRVITLNCDTCFQGSPSKDLAEWEPDIVLLQEIRPHQVREIADTLYDGRGDYRASQNNGIITRWKIQRELSNSTQRAQQATIALPNGSTLEVVNVHLLSATTDLRLWKSLTWKAHTNNRRLRIQEIADDQQILDETTNFPNTPTLFGGDFNAPATDVVHRQLSRDFVDAFSAAGIGWGNTFHRRLPVLRIDHIYATRHFTPLRTKVVVTPHSDHRFVVADFLLK